MTGKPAAWSELIASASFFPTTFGVPATAALGVAEAFAPGSALFGNDEKKRKSARRMARTARIATLLSNRGSVQTRPARTAPIGPSDEVESPSRSATSERSEEHTSELQSPCNLVCRLLLEKKKKNV